ncbi:MAG: AAA family ATPase [Firmicutes bacterium]|nr:AAA family ATPase [Bacillota bacterium]
MSNYSNDRNYEESRLTSVLTEVQRQLTEKVQFLSKLQEDLRSERKTVWEEGPRLVTSFEAAVNLSQQVNQLRHSEMAMANTRRLVWKLQKMLVSPYFARIDFRETGATQPEQIYIGISSLFKADGEPLVYDWRTPIASLFYDFELGAAYYQCQAGKITGDLTLKRQFKIENGRIIYMLDSNLKIDDEILQELLSQQTDEKMRTIVTSIQREQNQVIRDDQHQVLLVQGPAGSGKTSIALHRAAYYLYKERDSLSSENILIFSPNRLFTDYISNVLPELGEDPVTSITFQDLTKKRLPPNLMVEDFYTQLETLFSTTTTQTDRFRAENIYFKSSPEFTALLERYIQYLSTHGPAFNDLKFLGKVVLSKEQLRKLFLHDYAYLPLKRRMSQIQRRAFFLLRPLAKARMKYYRKILANDRSIVTEKELKARSRLAARQDLLPAWQEIRSWKVDTFNLYKRLFAQDKLWQKIADGIVLPPSIDQIRRDTLYALEQEKLRAEELAAYLYFQGKIEGFPSSRQIKHVIIDEAQDYTLLHYKVFNELFPTATFTILGDHNQAIHPWQYPTTFTEIRAVFSQRSSKLFTLNKSYRATRELTAFTNQLLPPEKQAEFINRPGRPPLVVRVNDAKRLPAAIADKIRSLQAEGSGSLAVITKTARQAWLLYQQIKESVAIRLISKDEQNFTRGNVIIPSYLAKGLEFDTVLIEASQYREDEALIFYMACTRALHRLLLFVPDSSSLLAKIDPQLYRQEVYS